MPFSAQLRDDFANDPQAFLRDYQVLVEGSLGSMNASNTTALINLMPGGGAAGPWQIAPGQIHVDLVAPQLYAYFEDAIPDPSRAMIPFAPAQVTVRFDANANVGGVNGLAVSLVPYYTGRSYGVRLPEDPNVAPAAPVDAFAMTATMDGCTLQISGSPDAPFVSHTNVADIAAPPAPWLERQGVMTQRLLDTLTAFATAVTHAGLPTPGPNHVNDPNYGRLNYGFWTNHYPQSPGFTVNYKHDIQTALNIQLGMQGGRRWRGARDPGWFTTDQYWLELLWLNIDAMNGVGGVYQPMWPPASVVVVGKRSNRSWSFSYQECKQLSFNITRESIGTLQTSRTLIMNAAGTAPEVFTVPTIMSYGSLWPDPTRWGLGDG